ncbi:MAG: ketoacyl-ACP synthase III [Marinisporobacter sp.]|jgi:3-oxoacyl-[acyl-carrier-protein] synthase-3|nr:ketoacyl-ACP synthase III [Marinisporobacter sp.]
MVTNVAIKEVDYYHPKNIITNDFFINHFEKQGKDIRPLLEFTGRSKRYISNNKKENMLTMGIEAAKKALKKANLTAKDMDLIVFSSGTPEFVQPTNALKLHHALDGKEKTIVYDMNSNCVGMVVALEQISQYMKNNPKIKYGMIVGAEQMNRYARYSEEIPYANFGDSGCAIILENTENSDRGFIDSDWYTDSSMHEFITLPAKGFSNIYNDHLPVEDKLVQWVPFNTDNAFISAKNSIEKLLVQNNLTKKDVKKYFLSQFAKKNIDFIKDELKEEVHKFPFIGDDFGYTGTTSPFIALAKTLDNGELKRGDVIIFWSVGSGITASCVLYRY